MSIVVAIFAQLFWVKRVAREVGKVTQYTKRLAKLATLQTQVLYSNIHTCTYSRSKTFQIKALHILGFILTSWSL